MSGTRTVVEVSGSVGDDQDQIGDPLLPQQIALAAEVRRLGDAVLGRAIDSDEMADLAAQLVTINDRLERSPRTPKSESLLRRNRVATFIETGRWPDPPPNGSRIEFDPASIVGGELNPFSMNARYYREGDEVVGFVNLGSCFEGPPSRVHGGVICAVFDEVMGSVFRATGTASAFTGELKVRFEAPAPLNIELEFRARLVESSGRRRMLEGEARSPEGQFATATGVFIEMKPEHFPEMSD
ncbi:MAG: PaaI family thioesterase [Acidimicrobiales bacterium]